MKDSKTRLEDLLLNSNNLTTLDDLKKAYEGKTTEWAELKDCFIESLYEEWSKYPNVNQYAHQITYKRIKSITDEEIYDQLMKDWTKK